MSHKTAIIIVLVVLGGTIIFNAFLNFMLEQFGLWFALPSFFLVIGLIYWIGFQSSASR